MFQNSLDIHEVKELRLKTLVYFGCGAIRKIEDIAAELEKRGVHSMLVVTGRGASRRREHGDMLFPHLKSTRSSMCCMTR